LEKSGHEAVQTGGNLLATGEGGTLQQLRDNR
jgi:hypothetical protein